MVLDSYDRGEQRQGLVTHIARQLDIVPESLRKWVAQAEIDRGQRAGTTTQEALRISELEREDQRATAGRRDRLIRLSFFRGGARPPTDSMTRYIDEHRDTYGVEPICRTLAIAPSTYYASQGPATVEAVTGGQEDEDRDRAGAQGELRGLWRAQGV